MSIRSADDMPTTSAESQKGSMVIARSAGSGSYERPERARTSHACEPCRERKTKCDGDRPSCRRCLHTGNPCHYGFGKGWRKRKTQEDLSSTSQRLARLETLLTEIMPLVEPRVQEMIHQARREQEQIGSADSPESEVSSHIGASASSMLPQTHANVFPQGRLPSLPNVFDPARPVSGASGNIPLIHRISGNEQSLDRLPSITASGMLIERDRLAALQRIRSPEAPNIRPSMSPTQAEHMMEAVREEKSAT